MRKENQRLTKLRDKLIKGILEKIPDSHLNGHPKKRLPNNANFWFESVEGESIVVQLDLLALRPPRVLPVLQPNWNPAMFYQQSV